ncbi:hypothetical protein M407DRAFT_11241 [Tulasnella calospora MUT 4182]|uniref:SNF2 N-terminal domain-containing protein n=1 Tax=Tulasnella calospora MUT 4182 TaxID=1051891 RepID=A0A0C3KE75_9AGAM|nr:hypothetical protein M407DRAFT_11241 [Tulasnella calospora MUT 4182]
MKGRETLAKSVDDLGMGVSESIEGEGFLVSKTQPTKGPTKPGTPSSAGSAWSDKGIEDLVGLQTNIFLHVVFQPLTDPSPYPNLVNQCLNSDDLGMEELQGAAACLLQLFQPQKGDKCSATLFCNKMGLARTFMMILYIALVAHYATLQAASKPPPLLLSEQGLKHFPGLEHIPTSSPTLIIVPSSLVDQWINKSNRLFAPGAFSRFKYNPYGSNCVQHQHKCELPVGWFSGLHKPKAVSAGDIIVEIRDYRNMGSRCLGLIKLRQAAHHMTGLSETPIYNSPLVGKLA